MLSHVRKSYPSLNWNEDNFAFQEQLRVLDAKAYASKRAEVVNGQHALERLHHLLPEAKITAEFREFIDRELKEAPRDGKTNVRVTIKRIWMYPAKSYAPFQKIVNDDLVKVINSILKEAHPEVSLIEGKIYLCLPHVVEKIWKEKDLTSILPDFKLSMNQESSHVTLVNSDVVCKLDKDRLKDFLEEVSKKKILLTCIGLSYTISLDWMLFSTCVVANISSDTLEEVMKRFNELFELALKPSFHLTQAICSRA
jgi:hypothetical protein